MDMNKLHRGYTAMKTARLMTEQIMEIAKTIDPCFGQEPKRDIMEGVSLVLTTITRHASAGCDHILHPEHSTIEKSSVCACFMTACSVPIVYTIQEQNTPIDVNELLSHAASTLFNDYREAERNRIIDEGMCLFQDIIRIGRTSRKMEEWMTSLHNVTNKYIDTQGDTEYVELFAPLYLVLLMATGQADINLAPNRVS